eukprot:CAMPEP_0178451240 /NCGR_PEP_ID=MMETSP0689_2-20121128/43572_1 /TAXON_ID=160604 /ORGANISM="Amphidinium massartii, Strain CS-259" /LENGTH=353 /DNA_ID=CAMNT_0020076799 /DNA_START=44 /DNA_END=1102 /DNA_ORIENTATION=+
MPRLTSSRDLFDPEAVGNDTLPEPPFFRRIKVHKHDPPYAPSVAHVAHMANLAKHPRSWQSPGPRGPGGEIWKVPSHSALRSDVAWVAAEGGDYRLDPTLNAHGVKAIVEMKTSADMLNLVARQSESTARASRISLIRGLEANTSAAGLPNYQGKPQMVTLNHNVGGIGGGALSFLDCGIDSSTDLASAHHHHTVAQKCYRRPRLKGASYSSFILGGLAGGLLGGGGEVSPSQPAALPEQEQLSIMRTLDGALESTRQVSYETRKFSYTAKTAADLANRALIAAENLMRLPGLPPGSTPMTTYPRPSLPRRPRDLAPAWLDLRYGVRLDDDPVHDSKIIEPYGAARDELLNPP